MKIYLEKKNKGFTRLVDFGDAILSRTKSASPKLTTGFTLVETLVAVFIFSMSIVGTMSVLASSISNISFAKQKITAGYLAQEGIEYMRNLRDTSVLSSVNGWVNNFSATLNPCNGSFGCGFDNLTSPFVCNSSHDCDLYINSGGYDTNSSGTDSGFNRKIWMDKIGSGQDEVKIFSKVTWTQGSGSKSITFSEDLFNWWIGN